MQAVETEIQIVVCFFAALSFFSHLYVFGSPDGFLMLLDLFMLQVHIHVIQPDCRYCRHVERGGWNTEKSKARSSQYAAPLFLSHQ